jgi:antitoxin component YwqK of YwqJK toxin-antitoxin module
MSNIGLNEDFKMLPEYKELRKQFIPDYADIIFSYLTEIIKKIDKSNNVKFEVPYFNGMKHGKEKIYYELNKIWRETDYVRGKKHKTLKLYYFSGQIECEIPYVNNKINGIEKHYYKNGQIRLEIPYVDDEIYGICRRYDKNGQLEYEEMTIPKSFFKMMMEN